MITSETLTVDRPQIVRFVSDLETAYAKEWPEKSARFLIDRVLAIRPHPDALIEAALVLERSHEWLPNPTVVAAKVAEAQRQLVRYEPVALPGISVSEEASTLRRDLYPDEPDLEGDEIVRRLHTKRTDCLSTTCDIHRSPEEISTHEHRLRGGVR